MTQGKRAYDKFPDLAELIEQIKYLEKSKREKLLIGIKDIIIDYDPDFLDKYVSQFPMSLKRRWYDKDPFSWMTINAVHYADEDLLNLIIDYLKNELK